MEWLTKLIKSQSKKSIEGYIGHPGSPAVPNETYLTIAIQSLWIPSVRIGLNKFYGAVYGSISIPHMAKGDLIFQSVHPMENNKELDAKHLERVIQGPYTLLNSVPFRGGPIKVGLSLFSVKSSDLAAPYIKLLNDISDKAGVAFISTAMPLVETIESGISALVGDNTLEIGRDGDFSDLNNGYYLIIRAERKDLPIEKLTFDEQTRSLQLKGKDVTDYPYFVLKISTSNIRDLWFDIPAIQEKFIILQNQVTSAPTDWKKNREAYISFKTTVDLSPDLLDEHAQKLIAQTEIKYIKYITEPLSLEEEFTTNSIELGYRDRKLSLQDFDPFS